MCKSSFSKFGVCVIVYMFLVLSCSDNAKLSDSEYDNKKAETDTCIDFKQYKYHGAIPNQIDTIVIDPSKIKDILLAPIVITDSLQSLCRQFEAWLELWDSHSIIPNEYLRIIGLFRDRKCIPLWKTLIVDSNYDDYFKVQALYALGETGDSTIIEYLFKVFKTNRNPLIREYVVSAIGKVGGKSILRKLYSLLNDRTEKFFVKKAIAASIRKIAGETEIYFEYLPSMDSLSMRRLKLFRNISISGSGYDGVSHRSNKQDECEKYTGICISPHQQYKVNRPLHRLLQYPFISYGFEDENWGIHVGEDSGWLFGGMSVYAILPGRVVLIQHEDTWGCFVGMESCLKEGEKIVIYYGHLSDDIYVRLDEIVNVGDKIGEIGPSFSLQNGGYLAHLHLGIERAPHEYAHYAGWASTMDDWYSPVAFLGRCR